ncbi:hypothetical protein HMPREF9621_00500 [Cutibacterium modestum HL037PA2]|nr:hypothetical protein HMPREF9621_00500 [Cutibacterium modestum HL037PA2]
MRSMVVNRRSHIGHCRLRRIAVPSSHTRESKTRESSCWQNGQRIITSFPNLTRLRTCGLPLS